MSSEVIQEKLTGINLPINSLANIIMEITALIVLLLILYSSIKQKAKDKSRKMFVHWNTSLIALLAIEFMLEIVCLFLFVDPYNPVLVLFHRIFFVIDYALYNLLPVTYYRYICSFITLTPENKEKVRKGLIVAIVNVFILAGAFASSLYTGWFFTIDTDTFESYKAPYLLLEFFAIMNWHVLLIPLKIYKRQYGKKKRNILAMYFWVPPLFLPLDYIFNITFSYAAYAFVTLFIYMEVDIQQTKERALLEAKIAQTESKMKNMQVELMMSQIHPHFLYNTLSSIACLCRQDPMEAEAATNEFSDYLKANLSSINSTKPIPFRKELLHAESYLKIQKRRFPENLSVEFDVQVYDFYVPALTLQTVVENAVKHAVESSYELTTIRISTYETAVEYRIVVEDDGPGFDVNAPLPQDRPHLGISSTKARLKEMVNGTMDIASVIGEGTIVTITIPKETEDENV